MQTQCSNCLGPIELSLSTGIVKVRVAATGRAGKRVEAHVLTAEIVDEGDLLSWEAPCCPDYIDTIETP